MGEGKRKVATLKNLRYKFTRIKYNCFQTTCEKGRGAFYLNISSGKMENRNFTNKIYFSARAQAEEKRNLLPKYNARAWIIEKS